MAWVAWVASLFTVTVLSVSAGGSHQPITIEARVLAAINTERHDAGLEAVTWNAELAVLAEDRSAQSMAHEGRLTHRPFGTLAYMDLLRLHGWLNAPGIVYDLTGEVLALNQSTPERAVQQWMESPSHKAVLLEQSFVSVGIGIARRGDVTYYTALFLSERN
jgi:uncharacterized protein YkwD